jgi:hypothetical protein
MRGQAASVNKTGNAQLGAPQELGNLQRIYANFVHKLVTHQSAQRLWQQVDPGGAVEHDNAAQWRAEEQETAVSLLSHADPTVIL